MSDIVKAVRLKKDEWLLIESFLQKNSFLDFSSLSRLALKEFIHNPKLEVKAVRFASSLPTKKLKTAKRAKELL